MFSDLIAASNPENPLPTIDRFMSIYEEVLKPITDAESIAGIRMLSTSTDNNNNHHHNNSTEQSKSSTVWVEAALATNLEVVSLLTNDYFASSPTNSKKRLSVNASVTRNSTKVSSSPFQQWTRGLGMDETVELGKSLRSEMQLWFVRFVEESLDAGFQVSANCSPAAAKGGDLDCDSIAAILSQLKRVNDWLDRQVSKRDALMMEMIDRLKKKIYAFVIQHVGNTTVSAIPANSPCPG